MQKANANGAGTMRFMSQEDMDSLRETATRIEALTQQQQQLRAKFEASDHGTLQNLMDGNKPNQPLIDEIAKIEAELDELKNTAMRQGFLLTADLALDQWIRPYVKLARQAAGPASRELAEMISIIYTVGLDVADGLKTERKRSAEGTAQTRKMKLDAYVKAGFTRREAFTMVLAEIKPPDFTQLNNAMEKAKVSLDNATSKAVKRKGTNGTARNAQDD
jgi:hypothetical protein